MRPRLFAAILSATSLLAFAGDSAPQMIDISQKAAKPGEIITVSGFGLSTKNVDEVYLTDHKFDMRVKVLDQQDTTVQFRVPPFAKPGRVQLLFLTKGNEPKLLEQPVFLLIEDPEAEVAIAKAAPESGNQGAATASETKAPETKADETKSEQAKSEPAKGQTNVEQAKLDQGTVDQLKVDLVKPILAKPDLAKPDLIKQDPRLPKL
jgi:hypothetical protein